MAISNLESLLASKRVNPDETIKATFFVERFNQEVEISFKRLSYSKYKYYKRAATERKRGVEVFDGDKYRSSIILDCLVDPDFTKKEFLDTFGAPNGEVGLNMIFLPGEIISIGELILKESGFSEDPFRDQLPDNEETTD